MHVLQRLAEKTPRNRETAGTNGDYDYVAGLRRQGDKIVALDPTNQPTSKKNDVETGEDQKGQ